MTICRFEICFNQFELPCLKNVLKKTHYPHVVRASRFRGFSLFVEVVLLLITYDTHENKQQFPHTALATRNYCYSVYIDVGRPKI